MARSHDSPDEPHAVLVVPRTQFAEELQDRIDQGQTLLRGEISSNEDLAGAENLYRRWDDFNSELLKRRFSTPEIADEYSWWPGIGGGRPDLLAEQIDEYRDDLRTRLERLVSLRERLPIIDESHRVVSESAGASEHGPISEIFIVHGHNNEIKQTVHSFMST